MFIGSNKVFTKKYLHVNFLGCTFADVVPFREGRNASEYSPDWFLTN